MADWKRMRSSLVRSMEFPEEIIDKEPVLVMNGRRSITIENYKCILKFSSEEIWIRTHFGLMKLFGKQLEIPCYFPEEIRIVGEFKGIQIESGY